MPTTARVQGGQEQRHPQAGEEDALVPPSAGSGQNDATGWA